MQRFIKFATVGFIGYLINASFLQVFSRIHYPELLSWILSIELAIISNFTLNNLWTFKEKKIIGLEKILAKFFHFNLTSLGALIIQSIFGSIGVGIFGPQYRQIILLLTVIFLVLPYNYIVYNVFIWKTWKFSISFN